MSNDFRRFTRQELHDLVWSEPMVQLAKKLGISDVGLAKACKRSAVPVPERGYWAKHDAGKPVVQQKLPPRGPGMSDNVTIGSEQSWGYEVENLLHREIGAPPVFPEELSELTDRVKGMVGKVVAPKTLDRAHPLIARYIAEDRRRREKQEASGSPYFWDRPLFDSAFERRRLRIINALFLALTRCGMKPSARGREARELGVRIGETHVWFTVDRVANKVQAGRISSPTRDKAVERLRLAILTSYGSANTRSSWEDSDEARIEDQLSEIVVGLIVTGEVHYREEALRKHAWLIEQRARQEEQARRRKAEEERQERERQRRLQQQRIDRLLGEALALRQATDIRAYVQAVLAASTSSSNPVPEEQVHAWATWARGEADRIDPIKSGRFLSQMKGTESSTEQESLAQAAKIK